MNQIPFNTWVIILGVVLIIIELLLGAITGFELLLVGGIFIIAGIAGTITNSYLIMLLTITVLSLIYVFLGRSFLKQKLTIATRKTSVDSLIGKTGIVVKKISSKEAGQIKIEGEIWRAVSNKTLDTNTEAAVNSISGVTLTVK